MDWTDDYETLMENLRLQRERLRLEIIAQFFKFGWTPKAQYGEDLAETMKETDELVAWIFPDIKQY